MVKNRKIPVNFEEFLFEFTNLQNHARDFFIFSIHNLQKPGANCGVVKPELLFYDESILLCESKTDFVPFGRTKFDRKPH
jgi:hypothetical protein